MSLFAMDCQQAPASSPRASSDIFREKDAIPHVESVHANSYIVQVQRHDLAGVPWRSAGQRLLGKFKDNFKSFHRLKKVETCILLIKRYDPADMITRIKSSSPSHCNLQSIVHDSACGAFQYVVKKRFVA